MARLVMKFGGTSVADIERIRIVARHVKREVDAGHEVAVVVSAMSGTTNRLIDWCRDASVIVRLVSHRRMSEGDAGVSGATAGRGPDFACNTVPVTRNLPETKRVNSWALSAADSHTRRGRLRR